jgi:hypothetical protein
MGIRRCNNDLGDSLASWNMRLPHRCCVDFLLTPYMGGIVLTEALVLGFSGNQVAGSDPNTLLSKFTRIKLIIE